MSAHKVLRWRGTTKRKQQENGRGQAQLRPNFPLPKRVQFKRFPEFWYCCCKVTFETAFHTLRIDTRPVARPDEQRAKSITDFFNGNANSWFESLRTQ